MPLPGRIEGRKSEDGTKYRVVQGNVVLREIAIHEAVADLKLAETIRRNGWEPL